MANPNRPGKSEKEEKQSLNKSFYLAEAFLDNGNSEVSMNTLVSKFLESKTLDEIIEAYNQYVGTSWTLGDEKNSLDFAIMQEYEDDEDPTPLYAKWAYYAASAVSAFRDLYIVCLRIARGESKKSAVLNIMDMLFFADKAYRGLRRQVLNKQRTMRGIFEFLVPEYPDDRAMPAFPLVHFYREFDKQWGDTLREKYGCPYHQTSIQKHFQYRYWEEFQAVDMAQVEQDLRSALWTTAKESKIHSYMTYGYITWQGEKQKLRAYYENYEECLIYLRRFDDKWLAENYISLLDRYTELRLSDGVKIKIDSQNGRIIVTSSSINTALFLWVLTEIQNTENFQVCKMCGRVFKLRSQKTREYCYLHSDNAKYYFNRKLREKNKNVAKQGEGAVIKVVPRRNKSEVAHEGESNEEEAECC